MNFLKRSIQYIWDKKGKSLLLIAVFTAILVFVLAGLTIQSATEVASENAQKSIGATVTLQQNRENMFKHDESSKSDSKESRPKFTQTPISLIDVMKISELSEVESYYFEAKTSSNAADGIEAISQSTEEGEQSERRMEMPNGGGFEGEEMTQGDFQITGVSNLNNNSTFLEGTSLLIDGEMITEKDKNTNVVMIETNLANENNLKVGDKFKLLSSENKEIEVTVKGIYETTNTGDSMSMMFDFMNPVNTIYSSYTLINELANSDVDSLDSAQFTLSNPEKMSDFVESAENLIDTETFSLQTNDQMYQQMIGPISNVSKFSKNIVYLVGIAGIIILTLIVMLSIRERRYEIGVLLSLGESRMKIIGQFFIELCVCMVISVVIAGFSGNIIGNVVGNQLLEQQTSEVTVNGPNGMEEQNGFPGGASPMGEMGGGPRGQSMFNETSQIEELEIKTSASDIFKLFGLGSRICLIALLLSSITIFRLNPKTILIG